MKVDRGDKGTLPLGFIRISLGIMSRFEGAEALVQLIRTVYVDPEKQEKEREVGCSLSAISKCMCD